MTHRTPSCKWTYDDYHCYYETSCTNGFCFNDGSPKDNHFIYCPYCGKVIEDTLDHMGKEIKEFENAEN